MTTKQLLVNWAAFGIAVIALFAGWNYQTNRTLDKLHSFETAAAAPRPAPSAPDPAVVAATTERQRIAAEQAKATVQLTLARAEAFRAYAAKFAEANKPAAQVAVSKPVAPPAYFAPSGGSATAQTWDTNNNRPYDGLKASWQHYDKSRNGKLSGKLKPGLYTLPFGTVRQCEKRPCAPSS